MADHGKDLPEFEEIELVSDENDSDEHDDSEDFDEHDDMFDEDGIVQIDDFGNDVERIVEGVSDVLSGIFINSEGMAIADTLTSINTNLENISKILYKIAKNMQ
jgi:hypothetical protein